MKRKSMHAIVLTTALFIACIFLYLNYITIGSMDQTISHKHSGTTQIGFTVKEKESLKFTYSSYATNGSIQFVVCDKQGNAIQTFEPNTSSNERIYFEQAGDYLVRANYKDFTGTYRLRITK